MLCRLRKWSYSKYGWQHGPVSDNWQGGQEWSAWVQTDRAGQRLHQEPAGIPAAEEQWGQFRADMCRQTGTSVRGWGGNVFLWNIWRERRASFILENGVGGTIEGRTRTGRKDKSIRVECMEATHLGGIRGEVIGKNDTGNWIWQDHC